MPLEKECLNAIKNAIDEVNLELSQEKSLEEKFWAIKETLDFVEFGISVEESYKNLSLAINPLKDIGIPLIKEDKKYGEQIVDRTYKILKKLGLKKREDEFYRDWAIEIYKEFSKAAGYRIEEPNKKRAWAIFENGGTSNIKILKLHDTKNLEQNE